MKNIITNCLIPISLRYYELIDLNYGMHLSFTTLPSNKNDLLMEINGK